MPSSYALGSHFEALMNDLIASGRYGSKSEILRDGLRVIEEREAKRVAALDELRALVREGAESGPGIPAEDVFAEFEARYTAQIKTKEE